MLPACSPGAVPPPDVVLFAVILQLPVHPPIQVPVQAAKQLPLQSFLQPFAHEPRQLPVQSTAYFRSLMTDSIISMYF